MMSDTHQPEVPAAPSPAPTDVEAADKTAAEAATAADDARAKADAAHAAAAAASQARADAADAARPAWQTVHETSLERTERLVVAGGYYLRSAWRHLRGVGGGDPLSGSAMSFVPGEAPPMANTSTLALGLPDLQPGVDPEKATLGDVYPVTQLATAPTVLLFLGGDKVRVLKSPNAALVGVTRPVTSADGPAPVVP